MTLLTGNLPVMIFLTGNLPVMIFLTGKFPEANVVLNIKNKVRKIVWQIQATVA